MCESLAPTPASTPDRPALWVAMTPMRQLDVTGPNWASYFEATAARIHNYLLYHRAMGMAGMLLYADVWSRSHLRRSAVLEPLLRQGVLRFVQWELIERSHNDDGRGRPLGGTNARGRVSVWRPVHESQFGGLVRAPPNWVLSYRFIFCSIPPGNAPSHLS